MIAAAEEIIDFWFVESEPRQWFGKDADFDQTITTRFLATHQAASLGELYGWRQTPAGRLAEIIVLDQFSRNIYRDQPQAFAYDSMALVLAQEAIANQADQALPVSQRVFVYMPFMHSESLAIHQQALELYSQPELPEDNYRFELKHKAVIEQFGRYPHRNEILGRPSTPEEVRFLQQPGSSF